MRVCLVLLAFNDGSIQRRLWQRGADQPFAFDDPGLFDTGCRPPERG